MAYVCSGGNVLWRLPGLTFRKEPRRRDCLMARNSIICPVELYADLAGVIDKVANMVDLVRCRSELQPYDRQ